MQCWVGLSAWTRIRELIRVGPSSNAQGEVTGGPPDENAYVSWLASVWASVQAILTSTAQISRVLWPEGTRSGKHATYAPLVRASIAIPKMPHLENRNVRNAFEHVESKAQNWFEWALSTYPGRPLSGFAIGDGKPMGPRLVVPDECFRFLNTADWTLKVDREAPLDLRALISEVAKLAQAIDVGQALFVALE